MNKIRNKIMHAGSRASQTLFMALGLVVTSCGDSLITQPVGNLPNEAALGHVGSTMRSELSISGRGQIVLAEPVEGEEPQTVVVDEIFYQLSKPVSTDTKVTISVGTELTPEFLAEVERQNERVKAYNKLMWSFPPAQEKLFGAALLPAENIQLESENLTVPAGKTISETVKVSVSNIGLSRDTLYLLPVIIMQSAGDRTIKYQVQYLVSSVQLSLDYSNAWYPDNELKLDDFFFTVFYVNTEEYQPLIASIFAYNKVKRADQTCDETCSIGNLINLRTATIGYDNVTDKAVFNLATDLRYVLEHREKYISPLQNFGRKVCVCIQGGGKGLGFCNLSDAQIADFTAQVKKVVYDYDLDGVNLWDEGAKYGKEGMPAVNTTSYPKLIKSLREAMPDKLLTLVDKDEPTESFYDVEACGGIEVGKYIDYAWSGFCKDGENIQIVEPWEEDHPYGEIVRKPIAGLAPENYGSFSIPRSLSLESIYKNKEFELRVIGWRDSGRRKNNMVVFGFDLTANEQTKWEGEPMRTFIVYNLLDKDDIDSYFLRNGRWRVKLGSVLRSMISTDKCWGHGYGLLKKDW